MSDTVISVEHLSKRYRLGVINTGTFRDDLKIWFAQMRGKPNPLSKVDEVDYGNREDDILWALRDVNFTVQRGEALGIIGRNGAGKSTLLKILSRVTTPTQGHVHVKGRIASLLEVGTGFHPELTGRENIYLNGAIMGMDRAEVSRKFDEIVDFSGVEKFIDTPVKRYSSGMYVRLAFAVAAHLEPEILIVDEVLAVGDADFQKKCLGKMGDVASEGRTVLFVSHNMAAIANLCNTTIYLSNGEINSIGPTRQIIDKYLNYANEIDNFDLQFNNVLVGDQFAKINRIRMINSKYETVNHLSISDNFGIEITYQILQNSIYKPRPTIYIQTIKGEGALHSFDPRNDGCFNEGKYKSVVWIPANLMNDEKYILTVGIASLNPPHNHCATDVNFEIEDDMKSLTRGDYMLKFHGALRPLLKWNINEIKFQ